MKHPLEELAAAESKLLAGVQSREVLADLQQNLPPLAQLTNAVSVITQTGSSVSELIQLLRQHFEFRDRIDAQTELSLSAIAATKQTLLWLPIAMALLGQFVGFDSVVILITEPIGWVALSLCAVLTWLAARTLNRVAERTLSPVDDPGFVLSLAALCVQSGMNLNQTRELLQFSAEGDSLDDIDFPGGVLQGILAKSIRLRTHAESQKLKQLAVLPEKLVRSTGLLLLPACMLVTVIPMAIGALRGVLVM